MPGAPWIDPAKAAQAMNLGEVGYSSAKVAEIVGLNARSVRDIIRQHGRWGEIAETPVFAKLRLAQNETLEVAFRAAAAESLALAMSPEKLDKASYYQLVIGSGIALDKSRLLAGESTSNIAVAHHVEAEDLDQVVEKLARSLLRFSTTVSDPRNEPIDVTPTASESKVDSDNALE